LEHPTRPDQQTMQQQHLHLLYKTAPPALLCFTTTDRSIKPPASLDLRSSRPGISAELGHLVILSRLSQWISAGKPMWLPSSFR
jgi:hypothetical protein